MRSSRSAGALALVGSGEYTAAMEGTDRELLRTIGDGGAPRVALLPTASAREPGMPAAWNARGAAHFAGLGVAATGLLLLERDDAEAAAFAEALADNDFFYFSGGNPEHLVDTFAASAAWRAIVQRHMAGAVVAGCSAGAMMLGGAVLGVRGLRQGQAPQWRAALGLAPGLAVLPHFDRMQHWLAGPLFEAVLAAVPAGITAVGIDEDTALVYLPGEPGDSWRVSGRQSVTVFAGGSPRSYVAGELVPLGPPAHPRP